MGAPVFDKVLALLEGGPTTSRNQGFDAFSSLEGRRIFRLYRLYRSLVKELEEAAGRPEVRVWVQHQGEELWLELEDPKVAYRRRSLVPGPLAAHFRRRLSELGLGRVEAR